MDNQLAQQLKAIVNASLCDTKETYQHILAKIGQGNLTRDEDAENHFCVYFLPYNADTKEVFLVHHKKSGLWLSPGGHIDKNEELLEALNREIEEELGVKRWFPALPPPFTLSITPIDNRPIQTCRMHYDVWYLVATDGSNFLVNPEEFHKTQWMAFDKAEQLAKDPATLRTLKILQQQ